MPTDIDLSNFKQSPNYMIKQPLYPFVEVEIGGVTITDFNDDTSDTVMDFSYRRTAKQDVTNTADNTFTLTLYDDTAIEIESLLYSTLLETARKTREELNVDTGTTVEGDTGTGDNSGDNSGTDSGTENNSVVTVGAKKKNKNKNKNKNKDNQGGNAGTGSGSTNPNSDTDDNSDLDEGELASNLDISDKLNNINIDYGWVDRNGNVVSEKKVNANFTKYSMEFEGASVILSIEGTSLDNTLLSSPSENVIKEYPASVWNGVASDIVKDVVDSTAGYTYKKGDIEATESILGEDGKPKTFIRNGETASVFIKKYLCEEAKSKKSGKVGYDFIVDNGRVTFKPSNISNTSATITEGKKGGGKLFRETFDMEVVEGEALGAGLVDDEEMDIETENIDVSSKLAEYARLFAYDYGSSSLLFSVGNGSPKEEYKEALNKEFPDRSDWDTYDRKGASCNVFVATVVRASGVDKNFPYLYMRQKARLRILGKWVDMEYRKGDKLVNGDIITYKKRKSGAYFIGIYIGDGQVACAMNRMSYGCILGADKLDEILDTDDKAVNLFREVKFADRFYNYDVDYEEDVEGRYPPDYGYDEDIEYEEDING